MSGNQEPRIRLPTWRCSDIPIKKRKYLVQPQLPVTREEAGSTFLKNFPHSIEKGDSNVGRSDFSSSGADENENQNMSGGSQKLFGESIPSVPFVSEGVADKAKSTGNTNLDQIKVKVEEQTPPIQSRPLTGVEIPSSSSILSMAKLPLGAEHPGLALTSDDTKMKVEHTVLKTHDIVRDACDKKILGGNCQTEATSGAGSISIQLGCKTANNSPYLENEGSTALNLSLSKGVSVPICTKSGNHGSVNRSNWDLNTTMDAWEDALERKTRVTGSFENSNSTSLHDIKTCDTTVFAKSVSEKQKENVGFRSPKVTLMRFDHQVNPACSLSLGLSSYPPIEKSAPISATTSEASAACTSVSIPTTTAGNVNSVNLRTVKSEATEEIVSQEAVCPIELPIKGVKQEVLGRFNLENNLSSGILKPLVPMSVKAEPNNFTRCEVDRKDGTLNHPHTPIIQSNVAPDLPTTSTPDDKDINIPCSNGISNAAVSLNEMTIDPLVQTNHDCTLKEFSGQSSSAADGKMCEVPKHGDAHLTNSGHGAHNLDALGVKGTSLTEDKSLDDCRTCISKELPLNSRGTSISDEENINYSGKELQEELHSFGVESDCGHDLSTVTKNQVGKINLYEDRKVQGPAAIVTEGTEVALAECGGYETERRNTDISFHGDFQNPNQMEEKGSQPALSGSTGDEEGQIVADGEGMSGVSTVSGGNVENPEIVDNSSPVSYRAGISTVDNEPPAECCEGSFVPLRMERDRVSDFSLEPRRFILRGSDESYKFSRERYHGKFMRSPRLNFMPDRRRLPDNTESNLHDRDTKNFEFDNHGNTRRGGAFMSNFQRGRRPANDEGTPYSHTFPRRTPTFSYTHRGPTIKENASASHGVRDGENFTRGLQSNKTEPMFMNPLRPYQGRNNYSVGGRTKFSNNPKRGFPGFRSQSPVRSREQSDGPSSSFRNRTQEEFSGHTDFSHRRSPSGYRMKRMGSPDQSGYSREMVVRRHNSTPFSHRISNAGRGWGYSRGRSYGRGGNFRKPSDRVVHRNHGNLNNMDPRERVDYGDDFLEGPLHSKQFGVDVNNAERRRFGYRHDATSSFRQSFNNGGCAPTNVENDPDAVRFGHDPDMEIEEQRNIMESDGKNKNSTDDASGRTNNMEEEETSKHSKIWQRDEVCGDGI